MSNNGVDFRWGIQILDDEGWTKIYGFMLRNYAKAGITRDEFLCLVHLSAKHYDSPNGRSRPSINTIAKQMGYADSKSVKRLIKSLEKKGMLTVTRTEGGASRNTNTYNVYGFSRLMLELEEQEFSRNTEDAEIPPLPIHRKGGTPIPPTDGRQSPPTRG